MYILHSFITWCKLAVLVTGSVGPITSSLEDHYLVFKIDSGLLGNLRTLNVGKPHLLRQGVSCLLIPDTF